MERAGVWAWLCNLVNELMFVEDRQPHLPRGGGNYKSKGFPENSASGDTPGGPSIQSLPLVCVNFVIISNFNHR